MPPAQKEKNSVTPNSVISENTNVAVEDKDKNHPSFISEVQKHIPEAQSPAHMEGEQKNLERLNELFHTLGADQEPKIAIGEAGANNIIISESQIPKEPIYKKFTGIFTGFFEELQYGVFKIRAVWRYKKSKDFYELEKARLARMSQFPIGEPEPKVEEHPIPPLEPINTEATPSNIVPFPTTQTQSSQLPEVKNQTMPSQSQSDLPLAA